ncbi:AAA family ATPase [Vibrio crassostreae]|uniref:AAA family ATPase n=1 Tax=Vibrio crassostreae TaxID=246167 RepID=UPI001B30054E|nr:AAA family ATPase [Vibrio crassostreae]
MEIHELKKVFTPSRPARITFVDRDEFNDDIVTALELPGTQLVVFGHTGSGKSTLVQNLLHRVYEKQITTNCMKGMTFEEVVLDAFDELGEFYVDEVTNNVKSSINGRAKANYLAIQTQLQASIESGQAHKQKRYLPPQLTPQRLAKLLGEAGYCWVLEDFHKIEGEEKEKLAQMMKVFVNLSDEHEDLKVIAIGAVNSAREVVETDAEMNTRISEFQVHLMNNDEIREIIKKGCEALNVVIPEKLQDEIIHYSNGLGSICHKLCYFMCDAALVKKTVPQPFEFDYTDLKEALKRYIKSVEDTIKKSFDKAMTINSVENTLRIVAHQEQDGAQIDSLLVWAAEHHIKITKNKLKADLAKLEKEDFGELIKFDENSWKYSFSNPFYGAFALAYFEEQDKKMRSAKKKSQKEMMQLLNEAFKTFTSNVAPEDGS